MAKLFVPKSSGIFAIVIFILLVLSVGLLVFVLKGQLHHEKSLSLTGNHVSDRAPPNSVPSSTHSPSPHTAPKAATTRSPDNQADSAVPMTTLPDERAPWQYFRLPKYILPLHYDLLLHPNLTSDTFVGTVNITVNVTRDTRHFIVHAYRLSINRWKVFNLLSDEKLTVEKHFPYNPHEYFVIGTDRVAKPGLYKLFFAFSGTLNGTIFGFYKSRYKNSRNETRYLATSKFQPTYARRAFPCFDEPSFKSTFTVSLVHEEEYIALSNMPVEVTEIYSDKNLFVTKFQKSVPMVTYLACFIVCDFDYQGTTISSGKPFRVYTTPDQVNLTNYAVKFGSRVLEYFENYFGIDYPLPKQDMVAIPDFSSGAMEHWGVITFRETNLLYDPENSSPQNLQRISNVISHEMTHMWFGNLVTMEWWDDLWLNEGFASYVEYKGVHEQHPQWDMPSQFVTEELQSVMNLDSTMNSHPIVQPVVHPDEITEIFDDISYGKGASVLRMLEFFVGEDNFKTGISNFLKRYKYKNAKTGDLWEELSETCGYQGNRSIADIMKTWTEQMGFPLINIIRRGHNSSHFVANQKRFLKNEELYRQQLENMKEYTWSVPLSYITKSGENGIIWLHDEKELTFSIPVKNAEWVKFNSNQTGFYLVNYEKSEWQKFINLLMTNHEEFTPSDRSNMLFDTFLLAEEGHIDFDVFLSMSKYLKNETHRIPWETAYTSFVYLCQLLESTEVNILLKSYMRDLTENLYQKLGWKTSDNHLENLLRTTIIGLACHSGNEDCLNYASELFQNWIQGQEVPSNLRSMVYNFGMAEIGREEHWNYMWNKYLVEESPAQKKAIMNGLAHVRKPHLILRYLEYAMNDENVRSQDFFIILSYIAGNPVGRPLVWNFIREKWPLLVERFTLNNRYLGNAVKKICSYFTTSTELQEMKTFFAKYPDAGAGKRRRQQALEVVQNNIKWISTHAQHVKSWLEVESSAPWYYHRLPPHIVPKHYDLTLHPMLDKGIFVGTVSITVTMEKPSDCFLLHAVELKVSEVSVSFEEDHEEIQLDKVFTYEENNYLVLKAKKKFPMGQYRLRLAFEGTLTVSLKGLYKSSYFDPNSKERRYLVATQFAAVDARRAFPCFDEPSFRATFNVTAIHNSSYIALSNTAVKDISVFPNGTQKTYFEKSLPMVTYLLSIVICDFKFKETTTENGIKLRVYAAPHLIERTNYALNVASKILTFYEQYFDIPFPLKKLDMVAIPDMAFPAMENWGLILYSQSRLLADYSSGADTRYGTCKIIAHELAHMWFGNLVTMKWWDDVWLNEGFATYLAPKGTRHVEPQLDKENDGISSLLISAMRSDQTINSHPIVRKVLKVDSGIYDTIVYEKAASMIRMLENYMGDDFREGISAYLKKYSYSNARTEDLWEVLTNVSKQNLNVSVIMDTWTQQMNYPFITIEKVGNTSDNYSIQQHRFLEDPDPKTFSLPNSPHNYVWNIPLTFYTSENPEVVYILSNSSEKENYSLPHAEWIKFNADFIGYYSVNYDMEGWRKLIEIMETNHTVFNPSDRLNLLFDAYSLASAGHLDYAVPLNLTRYLRHEKYHGSWNLALSELLRIKRFFRTDRETRELIKEFIRNLSKDLLKNYGWNDTGDYSERKLRKLLIEAACESGNQDCLDSAAGAFKQWMKDKKLSSGISKMVYVYGLKVYNNEESWEFVWNRFLEATDPNDRNTLLHALTTVRNTTVLDRLLQSAKNETLVRRHDYFDVLEKISQNSKGFSLITNLIFNKWDDLVSNYGIRETGDLAAYVFKGYTTIKDLEKVKEFYKKQKKIKNSANVHVKAIENIMRNINWIWKHQSSVRQWMKQNVYMPWRNIRLPKHITPTKYNITLHPNISRSIFKGEEEIELNITEKTDYLLLQQSGLKIFRTELRNSTTGFGNIPIEEEFPYKRNEFHVIVLKNEIPSGLYILRLKFSGTFSPDGRGMNRYHYTHQTTGETRYLLATRFEPTYARRVFPCFDEPAMKSKFSLSIIHDANLTAVSNMPEKEILSLSNDTEKTVFLESVKMSTYLLFCLVSDFEYLQADYKGKQVRAFAPSDRLHEAGHGLNLTVTILEKLEEFFDVPYALPKLDSVAIPNYTVPGMEHWGVIAYNTNRFLVDESFSAHKRIVEVDRVIAHEIVHQWFGNLVTMNWWNDLWLNEGVSTLIMYIPLRQYYPSIDEVDVRKVSRMMCIDSSMNSHPIVPNVTTPDEIEEVFDVISYEKGSAVMKMLQHVLKDDFRKGLSNYLKKYAYKNAETKDLWTELSNVTIMNISDVMDTWTLQMGFPYVELQRDGGKLTATQHWFSRIMNDTAAEKKSRESRYSRFGFLWKIPLVYKNYDTGNEYTLWLNNKTATFEINAFREDIVKFNPGFVGIYIVKYDDDDWARLGKKLQQNHKEFSTTDRYNLLHDSFMLAETGRLIYDIPLELTKYLRKENEALPWNLFRDQFMHFTRRLNGQSEAVRLLKAYVVDLTSDLYDKHVGASHNKTVFKEQNTSTGSCSYTYHDLDFTPTIVDLACRAGNKKCLDAVFEEIQLWLLGANTTADLHFVFDIAIPEFGDDKLWEKIYDKLVANDTEKSEKLLCAEGLVSFSDSNLIKKTIDIMVFDPLIDLELAKYMFQELSTKSQAIPYLWDYTRAHWSYLMNRLDAKNNPSIGMSHFCENLKTEKYLNEFVRLMGEVSEISEFLVEGCIEEIRNSVDWTETYEETLTSWLNFTVNHWSIYIP